MNALTNLLIPRILGNDGTQNVLAQQAIILAGIVSDDLSPVAVQNAMRDVAGVAATSQNPEVWVAALLLDIAQNGGLGGGATAFIQLTDVPSSYAGQSGKVPVVNGTETGLEFTNLTGGGDMLKSTYNPQDDGKIHYAQMADVGNMAQQDNFAVTIIGGTMDNVAFGPDNSFDNPTSTLTALGVNAAVITFLGTPSSANLAAAVTGETGSGALVFATSPTLVTPLLGTPTSGNLANCTGYVVGNLGGLGANVATFLATPSSANLAAALTDETGSGSAVFATSPTLVTPNLGTPSTLVLTNATGLPIAGGGTGASTAKGAVTNLCTVVDNANTTITLAASDSGTIVRTTSSSAVTVNLPASDPGAGFNVMVIQSGSGQVTFAANGNTLNSANSYLKIGVQHGSASLIRTATSTYNLSGYLAA